MNSTIKKISEIKIDSEHEKYTARNSKNNLKLSKDTQFGRNNPKAGKSTNAFIQSFKLLKNYNDLKEDSLFTYNKDGSSNQLRELITNQSGILIDSKI